ncbi:MAG TPA: FixH family protein [Methylotenera sp.]|nr:FixH family protein [Methylotenera sp.]
MSDTPKSKPDTSKAWWHYGHAWLVFGGPAVVVVACMVTVYIAVSRQDPVVEQDYYRKGIEINKTLKEAETTEAKNALEPAMRARNHAATGVNQEK